MKTTTVLAGTLLAGIGAAAGYHFGYGAAASQNAEVTDELVADAAAPKITLEDCGAVRVTGTDPKLAERVAGDWRVDAALTRTFRTNGTFSDMLDGTEVAAGRWSVTSGVPATLTLEAEAEVTSLQVATLTDAALTVVSPEGELLVFERI